MVPDAAHPDVTEGSSESPPSFQLTAISETARSHKPALRLLPSLTKIGRRVPRDEGHCLPPNWIQVSSYHCRVSCDQHRFLVTDTSTNGTFVNGVRVPKGESLPLNVGDVLRLSFPPEGDNSKLIEYKLEVVAEQKEVEDAKPGDKATTRNPATSDAGEGRSAERTSKRKRMSDLTGETNLPALVQLQRTNRELLQKLEASRLEMAETETRHSEETEALKAQVGALRESMAREVTQQRLNAETAAQAVVESLKEAVEKAHARSSELEEQRVAESAGRAAAEERAAWSEADAEATKQAAKKLRAELEETKVLLEKHAEEKAKAEAIRKEVQDSLRELSLKAAATEADLQQQLALEKSCLDQLQRQLQITKSDLEQQREAFNKEASARSAAEAQQAELQRKLQEAVRQNERAEESRQQALGTNVLQRAYLQKVLSISKHLRDARRAEEAARASAQKARQEADQTLQVLQAQVMTALHPDLDPSQLSLEQMEEVAVERGVMAAGPHEGPAATSGRRPEAHDGGDEAAGPDGLWYEDDCGRGTQRAAVETQNAGAPNVDLHGDETEMEEHVPNDVTQYFEGPAGDMEDAEQNERPATCAGKGSNGTREEGPLDSLRDGQGGNRPSQGQALNVGEIQTDCQEGKRSTRPEEREQRDDEDFGETGHEGGAQELPGDARTEGPMQQGDARAPLDAKGQHVAEECSEKRLSFGFDTPQDYVPMLTLDELSSAVTDSAGGRSIHRGALAPQQRVTFQERGPEQEGCDGVHEGAGAVEHRPRGPTGPFAETVAGGSEKEKTTEEEVDETPEDTGETDDTELDAMD